MVSGSRVLLRLEVFKVLKVCKDFEGGGREKSKGASGDAPLRVWGLTAGWSVCVCDYVTLTVCGFDGL